VGGCLASHHESFLSGGRDLSILFFSLVYIYVCYYDYVPYNIFFGMAQDKSFTERRGGKTENVL
jgi:hypothetical protein